MKLEEIYKHKANKSIIQIDSFAWHMNNIEPGSELIIYRNIERHNDFEFGSCPSTNGYGTVEEIEREYELLVKREDLKRYRDWSEVFKLLDV